MLRLSSFQDVQLECYKLYERLEVVSTCIADATNYRQQLVLISRDPMQLLPHGLVM